MLFCALGLAWKVPCELALFSLAFLHLLHSAEFPQWPPKVDFTIFLKLLVSFIKIFSIIKWNKFL